jgi:predicted nucleic acid-binding protein
MRGLFVDTSAWVALRDESDGNHSAALRAWKKIKANRVPLYSSIAVWAETITLLRRRASHESAVAFGQAFLTSPNLERIEEDAELTSDAWALFQERRELVLSFVDCLSFAIMNRLRLRQAFAFDADFKAVGYVLFPASPLL